MTRLSFHVYPVRDANDVYRLEDALETLPALTSLVIKPPHNQDAQVSLASQADLSPQEVVQRVAWKLECARVSFDA